MDKRKAVEGKEEEGTQEKRQKPEAKARAKLPEKVLVLLFDYWLCTFDRNHSAEQPQAMLVPSKGIPKAVLTQFASNNNSLTANLTTKERKTAKDWRGQLYRWLDKCPKGGDLLFDFTRDDDGESTEQHGLGHYEGPVFVIRMWH